MPPKRGRGKKKAKAKKIIIPDENVEDLEPENFENYQLGIKLGKGAFGSVYQGLDVNTGGLVAIKTIPLLKAKGNLASVQSEIDLMSGLKNEHIVQYICSHKTKDFLYIVMEFAEGGSLQHIQKKFANFDEHLAATYIYQVLIGLKYLHSQSIIHRDIKAANILLSNNIAKLSDFGISVNISDPNQQADMNCQLSAYWSAPEAINMEPITEKSDIWSLGITAIEMFTGAPPYFDLAPIPAMFKIVQNQETPLPDNISPEFKEFLQGCLTRNVTFRKSIDELLESKWIRKHINIMYESPGIPRKQSIKISSKNLSSVLGDDKANELKMFQEDSSDMDDDFLSSAQPLITLPPQKKQSLSLADFAEDDSDDFEIPNNINSLDTPFIPQITNNNMKQADFAKLDDEESLIDDSQQPQADLDEFAEDDSDGFDSDPFLDPLPSSQSNLKPILNAREPVSNIIQKFEAVSLHNPNRPGEVNFESAMHALDDIFADDNTEQQKEIERQTNLVKNTIQEMHLILQTYEEDGNEEQLKQSCELVKNNFKNEPYVKNQLAQYHGVLPMVEMIQTNNQKLLELTLPFISTAVKDQTDIQTSLCLLGVLPYLFNYVISPDFSEFIQLKSLKILHSICISQKKPVQMFISAGGLTKLTSIFENFPHNERPRLTELVIDIIDAVFSYPCRTPKFCFARIMAQSGIIKHLGNRYVSLPSDSPYLDKLCRIFETFSKGDMIVKRKMAEDKTFIDNIFTKARFKFQPTGTSSQGLNDWNLFLIIQAMNNLAMDKGIVQLLWKTNLVQYLIEYLLIDKRNIDQFHMNPTLNTCFSALFHLSRVLTSECVSKVAQLIPLINYILKKDLPLKEMATTLFLEFVNTHSGVKKMRIRLEQNDGVSTLFLLLKNNNHKEQILTAFEEWAAHNPQIIDSFLCNNRKEFANIIINLLKGENYTVMNQVVLKLIGICDRCKNLAEKLSANSKLLKAVVKQLFNQNNDAELRASLSSLILTFYQSTKVPKQWNRRINLKEIIDKTIADSSITVRNIGKLLVQADQLNYFF
ncbi:STE/STE11/CDC15 protein kinase [Histomonas meleagridis]|uniref:STE/STE11/CDC15 protein kinase n=1 Tax=Histomonas meleagridis TaxID=135588 RepID=UPI00355AC967|nr:STE/STE11/CDC15 protein kinase [Histomonas meleagridis]KAH0806585.1 STE/STE11/CDC15 protein kinase [Histomonas meleagridis]